MTTELQAVNQMLSGIGEAPVNSLDGALTAEVATARSLLGEVLGEVQEKGWYFNSDEDIKLTPDANGLISLSADVIRVDGLPHVEKVQVIARGARLYNRTDHNYIFKAPVRVNRAVELPWDDLPRTAKRYIITRALRKFQDRQVGNSALGAVLRRDEAFSLADLRQWDAEHAGYETSLNVSTAQLLNRRIH